VGCGEEADVESRPSIVRLWRILSTSSTRCLPGQGGVSATVGCIHAGSGGPGLQARVRKAFDHGFQARSNVELRLASILERSPKQGLFPANKAFVREIVRRHGVGIAMGAVGRRARIWPDGDKSSPGLIHLQA
jgi:hypothetical protein